MIFQLCYDSRWWNISRKTPKLQIIKRYLSTFYCVHTCNIFFPFPAVSLSFFPSFCYSSVPVYLWSQNRHSILSCPWRNKQWIFSHPVRRVERYTQRKPSTNMEKSPTKNADTSKYFQKFCKRWPMFLCVAYICTQCVELPLGPPTFKICTANIMGARTADGKIGTCTVNFLESVVFL